ncbi:MAG: 50S ribosomal protein L13 [bacterium]|nr:50S ribosomal protein L13 [bacterium]
MKTIEKKWYVVDAAGVRLGRVASPVTRILLGKHKPSYAPNMDLGDYVIVVNAEKILVSGKKEQDKLYHKHSGYPGGLKTLTYSQLKERNPRKIIEKAVKGMLPHNTLGRKIFKKLKVYTGPEHKQVAQKPEILEV